MNDIITNGTEIKQRILSEINNASQCVYVAMAYFTDRDIAMAIVEAKNRNVLVDIILSSNIQNDTVKLMLKGANIIVHAFDTGDARGIMHHKFCLIDNKITINGSYNYSINASNNNVENIHVSDETSTYSQFFSEFERLKYNIDNNIAVSETTKIPDAKTQQTQQIQPVNMVETFSQQLHNLVYSSSLIDTEEYKKRGYAKSKENHGNIEVFKSEYGNIKEEIRAFATDEGLSSKKNILTSNISNAYVSAKTNLDSEKQDKLAVIKRDNELERRQFSDKISSTQQEKALLESGNLNTGEKGLLQINKEIDKIKLEQRALEQSFVVGKFWTIGTFFILIGLAIFFFYLSIFFASALYKVFFEGNVIRESLEAGLNPGLPQLVDANAIIEIFKHQGGLFGVVAALFFLIPIAMSNLKLLGSKNKFVNGVMFWVGLLIFDIIVSAMVTINTDEIKCLLVGIEPSLQLWEVVKHGEFWLIFVFGMFPLLITHYLLENITNTYQKSRRELVDAERVRKIQSLDEEMIERDSEKESISSKIQEKNDEINGSREKIASIETELNNAQNQIENKYSEIQKQIKAIFDDFNAKIISGRIFTDDLLSSVVSAYKSGFIGRLPEYYAAEEVSNRVREIEQIVNNK